MLKRNFSAEIHITFFTVIGIFNILKKKMQPTIQSLSEVSAFHVSTLQTILIYFMDDFVHFTDDFDFFSLNLMNYIFLASNMTLHLTHPYSYATEVCYFLVNFLLFLKALTGVNM